MPTLSATLRIAAEEETPTGTNLLRPESGGGVVIASRGEWQTEQMSISGPPGAGVSAAATTPSRRLLLAYRVTTPTAAFITDMHIVFMPSADTRIDLADYPNGVLNNDVFNLGQLITNNGLTVLTDRLWFLGAFSSSACLCVEGEEESAFRKWNP